MDLTERLKASGVAHAQARDAETAARANENTERSENLQREARSLREGANRLHREIYQSLGGDKRGR